LNLTVIIILRDLKQRIKNIYINKFAKKWFIHILKINIIKKFENILYFLKRNIYIEKKTKTANYYKKKKFKTQIFGN